jgi:hypothetical protein
MDMTPLPSLFQPRHRYAVTSLHSPMLALLFEATCPTSSSPATWKCVAR